MSRAGRAATAEDADRELDPAAADAPARGAVRARVRRILLDALVLLVAALASFTFLEYDAELVPILLSSLAVAGLLVRRRWPWVAFAAALPAFCAQVGTVPIMVALFDLGLSRPRAWEARVAVGVAALAYLAVWGVDVLAGVFAIGTFAGAYDLLVFVAVYTVTPALLGALLRARRMAGRQLVELREARELGERNAAQVALARERAVLAREMHDVVSHQVSLIAVQAGALQVATSDPPAREVARTIRKLSTVTLDELRAMVGVLRAAGGDGREIAPQPTLADLDALVAASGMEVRYRVDLPDDMPSSAQRAVYRAVQEGLTNARKHATGSAVDVHGRMEAGEVVLDIDSGPATLPLLRLPSGGHGITGLRERAQLLGGSLTSSPRPDGSHRLRMRFPL
jgi:signal transduction histidine kinase